MAADLGTAHVAASPTPSPVYVDHETSTAQSVPVTAELCQPVTAGSAFRRLLSSNWLRSGLYCAAYLVFGLFGGNIGPSLPIFAAMSQLPPQDLGVLFLFRGIGFVLGCAAFGALYERMRGHRVLALTVVILALCAALLPLSVLLSVYAAGVVMLVYGGMGASLDIGQHTLLGYMHGHAVGGYIQSMQFCYGGGALLMPLIFARVLESTGTLFWSYWLVALLLLPVAVGFVLTTTPAAPSTTAPDEGDADATRSSEGAGASASNSTGSTVSTTPQVHDDDQDGSDAAAAGGHTRLLLLGRTRRARCVLLAFGARHTRSVPVRSLLLLSAFMVTYVALAHTVVGWLSAYAVGRDLIPSVETAAYLNSVFWAALTVGRLSGAALSFVRVPPVLQMVIPMSMIVASTATVLALQQSVLALWICAGVLGFSLGPLFGSAFAYQSWLGRVISSRDSMWIMTGAAVGDMTVPYLVGWFIKQYGYGAWPACLLALSVSLSVLCVAYTATAPKRIPPAETDHGSKDERVGDAGVEHAAIGSQVRPFRPAPVSAVVV